MHCWKIDFSFTIALPSRAEVEDFLNEAGMQLVEAGATGANWESQPVVTAFFYSDTQAEADAFARTQQQTGYDGCIQSYSISEVPDTNWTLSSAELLQPLTVGTLTVSPVPEASAAFSRKRVEGEIFIIPGMGFGTGHHPTTKTILSFLQHSVVLEKSQDKTTSLLDLGTGSGLLAIAAHLLYPRFTIIGIDNDAAAIDNAKENASLNNATDIGFEVADSIQHRCDILLANIYAEALVTFQSAMYDHLSASGVLILSGIMKEKLNLIDQAFIAERWKKIEQVVDQGWASILYIKE